MAQGFIHAGIDRVVDVVRGFASKSLQAYGRTWSAVWEKRERAVLVLNWSRAARPYAAAVAAMISVLDPQLPACSLCLRATCCRDSLYSTRRAKCVSNCAFCSRRAHATAAHACYRSSSRDCTGLTCGKISLSYICTSVESSNSLRCLQAVHCRRVPHPGHLEQRCALAYHHYWLHELLPRSNQQPLRSRVHKVRPFGSLAQLGLTVHAGTTRMPRWSSSSCIVSFRSPSRTLARSTRRLSSRTSCSSTSSLTVCGIPLRLGRC